MMRVVAIPVNRGADKTRARQQGPGCRNSRESDGWNKGLRCFNGRTQNIIIIPLFDFASFTAVNDYLDVSVMTFLHI